MDEERYKKTEIPPSTSSFTLVINHFHLKSSINTFNTLQIFIMHFQTLTMVALAGAASAAKIWAGSENIPDGPYKGIVHADGSTTMTHMEHGTTHHFELTDDGQEEKRDLSKRESHCWGYQLNHGGVDGSYDSLQRWAGNGQVMASGDTTHYYGFNNQGVYSYACTNAPHKTYTFNRGDIRKAFANMDGQYGPACRAYEAGYYIWPGTDSLVGKARSGTAVCLG